MCNCRIAFPTPPHSQPRSLLGEYRVAAIPVANPLGSDGTTPLFSLPRCRTSSSYLLPSLLSQLILSPPFPRPQLSLTSPPPSPHFTVLYPISPQLCLHFPPPPFRHPRLQPRDRHGTASCAFDEMREMRPFMRQRLSSSLRTFPLRPPVVAILLRPRCPPLTPLSSSSRPVHSPGVDPMSLRISNIPSHPSSYLLISLSPLLPIPSFGSPFSLPTLFPSPNNSHPPPPISSHPSPPSFLSPSHPHSPRSISSLPSPPSLRKIPLSSPHFPPPTPHSHPSFHSFPPLLPHFPVRVAAARFACVRQPPFCLLRLQARVTASCAFDDARKICTFTSRVTAAWVPEAEAWRRYPARMPFSRLCSLAIPPPLLVCYFPAPARMPFSRLCSLFISPRLLAALSPAGTSLLNPAPARMPFSRLSSLHIPPRLLTNAGRREGVEGSKALLREGVGGSKGEIREAERQEGSEGSKAVRQEGSEGSKAERQEGSEGSKAERQEGSEGSKAERQEGSEGSKAERQEGSEGSKAERQEGSEGDMGEDKREQGGFGIG
ncbi:unnamed protein product [Closterium sp. NIES-64]|nr:unnamed protein product [Closterium sp. NIES-64]